MRLIELDGYLINPKQISMVGPVRQDPTLASFAVFAGHSDGICIIRYYQSTNPYEQERKVEEITALRDRFIKELLQFVE